MKLPERMRDILEMLTIDDVARKLGVSTMDVQVLIDTNELSHYRLGQNSELVRIIRRDLLAHETVFRPLRDQSTGPQSNT